MTLWLACAAPSEDTGRHSPVVDEDTAGTALPSPPDTEEPFGPPNEWPHATTIEVPDDLVGTGWEVGDVATDFTFVDQHGDLVQLYQFYGRAVALDMVAMWAGPCSDNAPIYEDWVFGEAAGAAITWVAVVEEGDNAPVRDEDAALWAARHALNHPVVADTLQSHAEWAKSAYPSVVVLGPDMVIAMVDPDPVDLDAILALAPEDENDTAHPVP